MKDNQLKAIRKALSEWQDALRYWHCQLRNRLMTSHMELQNTIGFLRSSDISKVRNIVLMRLALAELRTSKTTKQCKKN